MANIDKQLNDYMINFVKRKISQDDFEQWLYRNDEVLEKYLGNEVYFRLIDINYKSKFAIMEVEEQVLDILDYKSYEEFRIVDLLSRLVCAEEDYVECCREIYDEYCSGYGFLRYIALTYIVHDYDYPQRNEAGLMKLLAVRPEMLQEAIRLLDFIKSRKIEMIGEHEYLDNRSEAERLEQRYF